MLGIWYRSRFWLDSNWKDIWKYISSYDKSYDVEFVEQPFQEVVPSLTYPLFEEEMKLKTYSQDSTQINEESIDSSVKNNLKHDERVSKVMTTDYVFKATKAKKH